MKKFSMLLVVFASLSLSSCDILRQILNEQVNPVPGYTGRIGCGTPMRSGEFGTFQSTLSGYDFEHQKVEMGKRMASGKCFTVAQVRQIAGMYDFEHTRLDMLKTLYSNTYDVDNYAQLLDLLDHAHSRQELHGYVLAR